MPTSFAFAAACCLALPAGDDALSGILSASPDNAPSHVENAIAAGLTLDDIREAMQRGVPPQPTADFPHPTVSGWSAHLATDSEGKVRPYQLYTPESVAAGADPTALVVHLHGSVARPDYGEGLGTPQASGYASLLWPELAEAHGFVIAAPQGRADCVWWSTPGTQHVDAVVRDIRRALPVPDRSILAAGFSDGASGCYHRAMATPGPFAGFIAMNGHPAVAASASGHQLYLGNMAATPMLAVATQEDSLYPSRTVLPHLGSAIALGAQVYLLSYPGMNHQPQYFSQQRELMVDFILNTKRDDDVDRLRWTTSDVSIGSVRWLEILELGADTGGGATDAPALPPSNVMSQPTQPRFGVRLERGTNRVTQAPDGQPAAECGIRVGDALIEFSGQAIRGTGDLRRALRRASYGDTFAARVDRDGTMMTLRGRFPVFTPEPIYTRDDPTAYADVTIGEDDRGRPTVTVTSHRVRRLRVWLPDATIGHDAAAIVVNGLAFPAPIEDRSAEDALRAFAAHGDASALRTRSVTVVIE
ncbi:MAG: PDZ domain-containing protein [Phycisphaerales bacterium]